MLPWNVIVRGERFGPVGSFLSPIYLAALPLAAGYALWNRTCRVLLVSAAVYTVFWFGTVQVLRYLIPVVPLISLCGAAALDALLFCWSSRWNALRRPVASAIITAIPVLLIIGVGLILQARFNPTGKTVFANGLPPVTLEQRSAYLRAAIEPYEDIEYLNQLRGRDYRVYSLPTTKITYFADGAFIGDWIGPARYVDFVKHLERPADLQRELARYQANFFLVHTLEAVGRGVYERMLETEMLQGRLKLLRATAFTLLFAVEAATLGNTVGPELLSKGGLAGLSQGEASEWRASEEPGAGSLSDIRHAGLMAYRSDGLTHLFQRVPAKPGVLYRHALYSRADRSGQYVRLQLRWFDHQDQQISEDVRIVPARENEGLDIWTRRAVAACAPASAVAVEVFATANGGSEVWVDDLSLMEIQYK